MRELRAAGIHDPELVAAYERCRTLNAEHGKTYYLATLLLPAAKRPFVHALYGFARHADDIVDSGADPAAAAARLRRLRGDFDAGWTSGHSGEPVLAAVLDTAARWRLPREHFEAFLDSMAMDLSVTSYRDYDALRGYMYGSAAVIGLQLLPLLEPSDAERARAGAIALGEAFQLANFIRDVGEDLDRGRIYLPLDELAAFGVDEHRLRRRVVDADVRAALAAQVARVRDLTERAQATVDVLHPATRDCIRTAATLYSGIAEQVAAQDYQVFARRASVPLRRRLAVAGPAWLRATAARRGGLSGASAAAR